MKKLLSLLLVFMITSIGVYAQDSTATVHFYRSRSMKGAAITYKVFHDSTLVGQMKPGTVYVCSVKPGVNKFTAKTESKESIFINVEAGKEYFVNCTLAIGMLVGRPKFVLVKKEEGEVTIAKIKAKEKK
jgi:hypothetical protein